MIKKFHVLYVGQIELDNIGLNGTPANDRRYSDQRLREAFNTAREIAELMDELGFDVLWTVMPAFKRTGEIEMFRDKDFMYDSAGTDRCRPMRVIQP